MNGRAQGSAGISPARRFGLAVLLGALTALAPLSIDMYLPALPTLARELHTSASLAQLSLTFCLLGLALGQLIAGPISDARGRRRPLCLGLALYAAASVLCALTSSIWLLIGLRFLQGLSGAAGIVIARAVVRDYFSGTAMTQFFAILMLVNGAAPILAPIIGAQLLRLVSWHGVFVLLCVSGIAMLLGALLWLSESLPPERRASGGIRKTLETMRGLLVDVSFMRYVFAQGLIMAAMFAYIAGSPFVIQNLFSVSPQVFSLIFATNGFGIIVAGQVSARLSARLGEGRVLTFGLCLAGLGSVVLLIMLLTGAGLFAVLPPLFAVVASVGLVGPPSTSLALQDQGGAAGSAAALIGVSGLLAGAAATPLVGVAGGQTATPMSLVILVCDLTAVGTYAVLRRKINGRTAF